MSVETKHPQYDHEERRWATLRDAYAGEDAVRAQGTVYLPCPAGLEAQSQMYAAYNLRATWFGATERATEGLTGAVFRYPPALNVGTDLEAHLQDVTLTGVPFQTFAQRVVREDVLMGRFGVLLDVPVMLPGAPNEARPYWVGYAPEEIINWRTVQVGGDTRLALVVLRETLVEASGAWGSAKFFECTNKLQYRVLRLNELGFYEVSIWEEVGREGDQAQFAPTQVYLPLRGDRPLDFIPFQFFAPQDLEPDVEQSLLMPLVRINYRYFRHSADFEHALHLTACPTPWITGHKNTKSEFLIGSQVAWVLSEPEAKIGMLEYSGQGLTPTVDSLKTDIHDMATLGARLLEAQAIVAETATAVVTRHSGADSPMQTLVANAQEGLTRLLRWHAWWAGMTEEVQDAAIVCELNRELVSTQVDPTLINTAMQAFLQNTISFETWYAILQGQELTRPGVTADDERALIEVQKERAFQEMQRQAAITPFGRAGEDDEENDDERREAA